MASQPDSDGVTALLESNRLARLAESLAGHGHWRVDLADGHVRWSEQMYRIYGIDPRNGPACLQTSAERYCHPDDREKLLRHRAENADVPAEIEVRIVREDGEIRHVIAKSLVERDEEGAPVARFGTLSDITELRRAQAAANESDQRFRFIAENVPDMISRTTIGGDALYVSPSSERVFGYTPEEMNRQNAVEMVHPDDVDRVMKSILRLISERIHRLPEPLRYRARHKDGRWIWIEANPTLVTDEVTGDPIEFIDVVRDITQTKTFEAELEEARRRAEAAAAAKSAFLANMSHELRTPLTSIIGFARLLGERADLTDETRRFAKRINDASGALLAIINDVLDVSKLDAGQVALEQGPVPVRSLLEEAAGLIAVQAETKGLDMRIDVDPKTPPHVVGDAARLRQVLLNLLGNAVKFTERGDVTVSAAYDERRQRLKLSIADTGPGIPAEGVARLFERFSQAEVSINRTHGGTGLGLAICKNIVGLMGGEIGVETTVGVGSTFWFEIPASPAEAVATPAAPDETVECLPLRVLLVDDTAVNRELVKLMLAPLGVTIVEAPGGAEAIEAAGREPFDLILMDVRMPGVDGLEAARAIRASSRFNAETPILALTADVQPENAAACREAGMNDHIAKPIEPAELLSKIAHWAAPAEEAALAVSA